MHAKLTIQPNGSSLAISFRGDAESIAGTYGLLWQWGAINSEIHQDSDSFAFAWTNKEQLQRGLIYIWFNRLMGHDKTVKRFKGKKGGLFTLCRKLAMRSIRNMPKERFLSRSALQTEPGLIEKALGVKVEKCPFELSGKN